MAEVTTAHKWLQLPDEVVAAYNAWDCLATVRAHKALLHYLRKNGQLDFYNQEVWPLIPVVQAMQRRGLPYDMAAKTRYRRRLRAELRTWDERLRTLYAETMRTSARWPDIEKARELVPWFLGSERPEGKPPMTKAAWKKLTKYVPEPLYDTTQGQPLLSFNLGSDYHLRDWLFNGLKLKPSTQTETKLPSVDQDALNRILGQLRARRKTPPGFAEASPEEQWELLPTDEKVLCGLMHRARLVKIDTDYLDPEVCYEPDGNGQVGDLPDDILAHKPGDTTFDGLRGGRGGSVQQPIRYRNRAEPVDLRRDIGAVQVGGRRGRVFPRIKLTGTESGRFSYADPPVHSWPDEIRHLVAPGPGYCIVGADARAIEARVFALEVGDEALIELFERNAQDPENPEFDLHIRNACDLFDWTLEEFLSFSPRKQKASRNTAKCLSPDTWVQMHDGSYREAQDIRAGDWLSTGQVSWSGPIGSAEMVRVQTTTGHDLEVTDDHPFLVQGKWVKAKDLVGGTKAGSRITGASVLTRGHRISNPDQPFPDELFRLLGYLVGDGNTTHGHVGFSNVDSEVVFEFARCVESLGGHVNQVNEINFNACEIGWAVDCFGLRGKKAIDKEIPEVVWQASNRQRALFLTALFEADGHTLASSSYFSTSSTKLARGLHLMLDEMGVEGSLCSYQQLKATRGITYKRTITCHGRALAHWWPFVLERKRPQLPQKARGCPVQVAHVWPLGVKEAWGLTVIPTHFHVTEGVVSHNTFQYGVVQYGGQPTTAKTKVSCPCPWCADKVPPSLRLSPAEKERQAQRWFARHPRTYFWRAEVSRELAQRKALTNRFGRKRYFAEPYRRGSHVEREGWNWKIQSSAVDIINRALRALHEEGVALILQHHDGLYAEAPEEEAPTIEARMRRAMQKPVPEYGGFVFPVEVHSGPNWGELA